MLFSKKQPSSEPPAARTPLGRSPRRSDLASSFPTERQRLSPDGSQRNPARRTPPAGQNRTFSYYANRSQAEINVGREALQSKPPIRRLPGKLQKLRRHFGWILVAIMATGLLMYELQLSSVPKIVALTGSSDTPFLRDTAEYRQKATSLFQNSAADRNKLTIDSSKIASDMKQAFPELEDVSVSLPLLGGQATLYVRPAEPAVVLAAQGGTFILDDGGRALATAGAQLGSLHIPTVTDKSGLAVSLGQQALPRSTTEFIQTVVQQLQSQGIKVQSLTLPTASSQLNAYISGVPYYVKFNIHDSAPDAARVQAGTYAALAKQLSGQHITPSQYVDVRIEGRAYYQ